jgi:hypothetical protein
MYIAMFSALYCLIYLLVDMQTVTLYTPPNFNLSSIFLEKGNIMQNVQFKNNIVESVGPKFFTACFTKQNGIERIMTCRLGVTKHLKGGVDVNTTDYLTVWEPATKGYRNVSLDTLQWIKCRGVKMDVAI